MTAFVMAATSPFQPHEQFSDTGAEFAVRVVVPILRHGAMTWKDALDHAEFYSALDGSTRIMKMPEDL